MKMSGFTFVHNANEGGYPLKEAIEVVSFVADEVVVVDMASTDGTTEWLREQERRSSRIMMIDGEWRPGGGSHACLGLAYARNLICNNQQILHFEADEVFDPALAYYISDMVYEQNEPIHLSVPRLQVEQNFQRIRWYPEWVHRVFPRGSTHKQGHTSDIAAMALPTPQDVGFLWDVTACFRDNWLGRQRLHAELWGKNTPARHVPLHFLHPTDLLSQDELDDFLAQDLWEWKRTPLELPPNLQKMVGRTKYELT